MRLYFNKFIQYLQEQNIEISISYFLILQKIKQLVESGDIDVGRGKMSDKLKLFFNSQDTNYYTNNVINTDLSSLLCEDLINNNQDPSIDHISSLQIKNFRGFSQVGNEDNGCRFDFINKQKAIIYGPNGSGKSSFSEALEYALTGDIKECKRKNKGLANYIKNNQNLGDTKVIINNNTNLSILLEEKEFFKRCIIEKNRITEFSLFRSKDTGLENYEDALTFLLGFEELNNFISSFVKAESFTLQIKDIAQKDLELYQTSQKTESIVFESKVKELIHLQNLLVESSILLYNDELKIHQYNTEMIQEIDQSIYNLEKDIQIPTILSKIHKHEARDFEDLSKSRANKERELGECINKISEKRSEINLKKLYEAISSIPEEEKCPACHTPKNQWARNPFEIAKTELLAMEEIIQLEKTQKEIEIEITNITEAHNKLNQQKINNQSQLAIIINNLQEKDYFSIMEKFLHEPINIEDKKRDLVTKKAERDSIINKIDQYNTLKEAISKGPAIGDPIMEQQKKEALIIENTLNMHLNNIATSYRDFRNNIESFYSFYVESETHGMWDDVCEYYKKINEHDQESEQVGTIEPITSGGFTIKLAGLQGEEITNDAVSYLSEGHLKALGLAVLWANMKKHNVPFMIFDDVVNAIDIEHRSNIINILHTDDFLSSKQMIITTHDRLFWEKFCNSFNASDRTWISYILVKDHDYIVPKEYGEINYISKVTTSIEFYDIRQSLLYTRIWFESLIYKFLRINKVRVSGTIEQDTSGLILKTSISSLFEKFDSIIRRQEGRADIETHYLFTRSKLYENIINQEGHAHDEHTYNLTHSTTSQEITEIKDKMLIIDPFINNLIQLRA